MGLFERYLSVWVGLAIIVGLIARQRAARPVYHRCRAGICPCKFSHRSTDLANDIPHDGSGRFFVYQRCGQKA